MNTKKKKIKAVNAIINRIFLCMILTGCQANSLLLEPCISFTPSPQAVECLPTAFKPLSPQERRLDWGKELVIADAFAGELDLYRAITSYKRALFLIPSGKYPERYLQIEYGIIQSYYFGKKYQDVINTFEDSTLKDCMDTFPARDDLLIILQDSYRQVGLEADACKFLQKIEESNPDKSEQLQLSNAILHADLPTIETFNLKEIDPSCFLASYYCQAKSVRRAQALNAFVPGAGYLYVGQKQSALTSFLLNAFFIAAATHFFQHGNVAAGLITLSLETGWYFGGINGAGLAAKEYNERLYETNATPFLLQNHLFPILMLECAF